MYLRVTKKKSSSLVQKATHVDTAVLKYSIQKDRHTLNDKVSSGQK